MEITIGELIDCFEDNHERLYKKAVKQKVEVNHHYTFLIEEDGNFIVWCGLDERLFHIRKNQRPNNMGDKYIDTWLQKFFPKAYQKFINSVRLSKLSHIDSQP